ncbi:mucin-2-like isoform X2 [Pygocentrus nattereri]|uniref:mucin-2-like isoform X2 n=1 Tax=Pygocentrus nattereri TaxID=42514 RepID=UPI0018911CE8|nr:mucin-2-like isoform X2 [Pygocentrus nattereri]
MVTLTMLRVWVLSVAALLNGLSAQETDYDFLLDATATEMITPTTVSILPTTGIIADSYESLYGINVNHNMQVCSTWGNFHFSTFDGQFFQLPYTCNYILTTLCDSTKTDFNIQMRRQYINNLPTIRSFTIKIDGVVVKLLDGHITMNDKAVTIPSYQYGVRIEKTTSYIKISSSKLEVEILWDQHNFLSVEIPTKYRNQTCGLCGDFNGVKDNEFIENGAQLTEEEYGHKWKMDAPAETCEEIELHTKKCQSQNYLCEQLLSDPAFSNCHRLLSIEAFVEACVRDVCQCNSSQALCLCDTISEFSRQCAHAGGKPQNWRTNYLCGKECPFNLEHKECGSPCKDTCSNQEGSLVCNEHCSDGCFCPAGTVFNDIEENGCIPVNKCPCIHNGRIYQPGESYNRTCQKCVCSEGRWSCVNLDCPGTCSIQGGSHITTYDGKAYNFHGNCYYVLSKDSINDVTVLGHLVQCGQTEAETCLTDVKFIISETSVTFSSSGSVLVNEITTKLPILNDQVTVFKPSTFYIIARSPGLLLVIQMVPVMQVYIMASSKKKGTLSGLCGNFNDVQADDFKTKLGLTEGTGATFANTWKAMSNCPDISISQENPCSMSVEKEKYAREWCNMLTDPKGVFSPCHAEVNPKDYKDRCIYDTCNCAKSEECMCAAVSSYVYACAAKRVQLHGWRNATCGRFSTDCPGNMEYHYSLSGCGTTCRSLSGHDHTCQVIHTPVDGCGCAKGTYLSDKGECVPASSCPCYYNNQVVAPSQVISKDGTTCTCTLGKLHCIGQQQVPTCEAPMYFFNCSNAGPEARGTECQKSCQTLDSDQCVSTECMSGCVCPSGLLADGQGGCVKENNCPCVHNGVFYQPGQTVKEDCNTCTCRNGTWSCTHEDCPGTCTIYGDGHYITFDGRRYSFSGDCEYTLVQDYCSNTLNGSFRVITENIPCGTTGTTCSKSIKIFLGNKELLLSEENIKVLIYDNSTEIPYKSYTVGIYLVIEASHGLVLFWDKKTSLMIKLEPWFKGTVCGLCGNYDGNGKNDFVTRGGEEVVEPLELGNSWRVSPTCPKASSVSSPCDMRPHRQTWAVKHCSIIKSDVFSACHSLVDPAQYYDICVQDTCACDSGGDCECFCTAVAAYAAACNKKGACISWRTPTICPLFCDYYNSDDDCEWHYKPCGQCVKTCNNLPGDCFTQTLVEGCFPKCPSERPYLEEEKMKCVSKPQCGCYMNGQRYKIGEEIPTKEICKKCTCSLQGPSCYSETGKVLYNTTDGDGTCIFAECGLNGTIIRKMFTCIGTPSVSTTIFTFSTPADTSTTTETIPTTTAESLSTPTTTETTTTFTPATTSPTTPPIDCLCKWSEWFDSNYPNFTPTGDGGEIESIDALWNAGNITCWKPEDIECRAVYFKDVPLSQLPQNVTCNPTVGLICNNKDQIDSEQCYNFEIRVKCCNGACHSSSTISATPSSTTLTSSSTPFTTNVSTTTEATSTTTMKVPSTPLTRETPITIIPSTTPIPASTSTTTETIPTTTMKVPSTPLTRETTTLTSSSTPSITGTSTITETTPATTVEIPSTITPTTLTHSTTSVTESKSTTRETMPTTTAVSSSMKKTTETTTAVTTSTKPSTSTSTEGTISIRTKPLVITTLFTAPNVVNTTTTKTTPATTVEIPSTTTEATTTLTPSTTPVTVSTSTTTETIPTTTMKVPSTPLTRETTTLTSSSTHSITGTSTITETTPATTVEIPSTTTEATTVLPPSTTLIIVGTSTTAETTPATTVEIPSTTEATTTLTPSTTPATVSTSTTTETIPTTTEESTTLTPSTTTATVSTSTTTETIPTTTAESLSTSTTTETTTTFTPATTSPTTPPIDCLCKWSEWFDSNYPNFTPTGDGGEIESIDALWNAGNITCWKPEDIECRAVYFKDVPLSQLPQNVTCNPTVGLICNNKDQIDSEQCYNFEIRVKCCNGACHSSSTISATPSSTTLTSSSTPFTTNVSTTTEATSTTTMKVPSTPLTRETPITIIPSTTPIPASTSTTTETTPTTTMKVPSTPLTRETTTLTSSSTPSITGTSTITETTLATTVKIPSTTTEATTVLPPSTTLIIVGTSTTAETTPATTVEIPSTTEATTTLTPSTTTATVSTSTTTKTIPTTTVEIVSTTEETTTFTPSTTTATVSTSTTTEATSTTTMNVPSTPLTKETTITIIPSTTPIPASTSTTTETIPTTTMKVPSTPLTRETTITIIPSTTPIPASTSTTTETIPTTTMEVPSTPLTRETPITIIPSTTPIPASTSTTTETIPTTTMQVPSTPLTRETTITIIPSTTPIPASTSTTTETIPTTTMKVPSTPLTRETTTLTSSSTPSITGTSTITETTPATTVEIPSTTTEATTVLPPSTTLIIVGTSTTAETTPATTVEIPSTTEATTTSTPSTPIDCLCKWSEWFDSNYPNFTPTGDGGEIESIDALWNAGNITCWKPEDIECRAVYFKDVPLSQLPQNVTCNPTVGLICNNKDQIDSEQCYNFEIRVKCCNGACHSLSTTSATPSSTTATITLISSSTPSTTGTSSITETTPATTVEIPSTITTTTLTHSTTSVTESKSTTRETMPTTTAVSSSMKKTTETTTAVTTSTKPSTSTSTEGTISIRTKPLVITTLFTAPNVVNTTTTKTTPATTVEIPSTTTEATTTLTPSTTPVTVSTSTTTETIPTTTMKVPSTPLTRETTTLTSSSTTSITGTSTITETTPATTVEIPSTTTEATTVLPPSTTLIIVGTSTTAETTPATTVEIPSTTTEATTTLTPSTTPVTVSTSTTTETIPTTTEESTTLTPSTTTATVSTSMTTETTTTIVEIPSTTTEATTVLPPSTTLIIVGTSTTAETTPATTVEIPSTTTEATTTLTPSTTPVTVSTSTTTETIPTTTEESTTLTPSTTTATVSTSMTTETTTTIVEIPSTTTETTTTLTSSATPFTTNVSSTTEATSTTTMKVLSTPLTRETTFTIIPSTTPIPASTSTTTETIPTTTMKVPSTPLTRETTITIIPSTTPLPASTSTTTETIPTTTMKVPSTPLTRETTITIIPSTTPIPASTSTTTETIPTTTMKVLSTPITRETTTLTSSSTPSITDTSTTTETTPTTTMEVLSTPITRETTTLTYSSTPSITDTSTTAETTPTTTMKVPSTPLTRETTTTLTSSSTPVTPSTSTTQCVCTHRNMNFLPGSFIYNVTDGTGWCITAYCDAVCNIHKDTRPCPSTAHTSTTQPTTTTTTPTSTTSTPTSTTATTTTTIKNTTTTPTDCTYLNPPRKNGETWTENCVIVKCLNGLTTMEPLKIPPLPVCANKMPPVKLENDCYHYECPCRCMGWGDPHYVTFDGQYYAFQGNCTYVLVQEIIKKYNFSVHIKNYFCDPVNNLACPESLTIYYKSYKIDLTQTRNPTVNKVFVNGVQTIPAYSNSDFRITTTGIQMTVNIPAIKAQINFAGLNFVINLPSSLFYNNTEGQCGVCDNITENDCRLRSGEIQTCETTAQNWTVTNNYTQHCLPPTTTTKTPTSATTKTPTSTSTENTYTNKTISKSSTPSATGICDHDICEIILSNVFDQCHPFYPPDDFYKACKYDVCNMHNATGCYSLESYATLCAKMSVCVDWRNFTNGLCEYKCSSPKVYQACGPVVEETCNSKYNDKFVDCNSAMCQGFKEGCFCPNGTTLFNTVTGICTPTCGCVGPDGLPRKPGDKWSMNCKDCECRAETMGPVCKPVQCPAVEPCNKTGFVIKAATSEHCCPVCECDPTLCPSAPVKCETGLELVQNKTVGDCCSTFSCRPKPVCVFNGTEYWPGVKIPVDICEDCSCGSTVDPKTGLLTPDCSPVFCNTTCSQGFIYEHDPEKCCGQCKQQRCVYTDPNSTVYTIEVGKTFSPPNEKCVNYNCTKVSNAFELLVIISSCPAFNPENCIPGTVTTTPDGCCETCETQNCRVQKNNTYLVTSNCTSVHPVEITSCSGSCDTSSIYSMAANSMMHRCSCCQELRTRKKQVEMNCADQRQITYTYTYVEECGCHVTECKNKENSG